MAQVTTVVLAGGPPDEVSRVQAGAINKAFVNIAGVPLVTRTLRALRSSQQVGRLIVVAPAAADGDAALSLADERRDDGEKIRTSLSNGLRGLPPDDIVLVSTSDLPVLTTESIDDFIARVRDADADVAYGCLEKRVHMAKYPTIPHTWAPLRDGTYCGGGFIAIKPRAIGRLEEFLEALGAARKNPLQLASLFGWDVLLRFVFRRLSIASAERRASQLLGASVRAIPSPFAETGVNVDRASDIALAESLLGSAPAPE